MRAVKAPVKLLNLTGTMATMIIDIENNLKTGDLQIYPEQGQVKIGNENIRLGPVNMKVLLVLIQNQGKVVSRVEIFDTVWKNQIVSDDTLTRCISDLRTQFSKHTKQALIKTIPKRGYQWIPQVEVLATEQPIPQSNIRSYFYWLVAAVLSLFILSTSFLWLANSIFRPDYTHLVLMPIQATLKTHQAMARDLEDVLRKEILQTSKIRLLASSVMSGKSNHSFIFFANEFGTKWVVEGRIRKYHDKIRATLSLVDARTTMEIYSLTIDNETQTTELSDFSIEFIRGVEKILNL